MANSKEKPRAVPAGYRRATADEDRELLSTGFDLQVLLSEAKRYEAEARAAKLSLQKALSEIPLVRRQRATLLQKLGIKGEPGDVLSNETGSQIFILVDPKKRLEKLPDPPTRKASKEKGRAGRNAPRLKPV